MKRRYGVKGDGIKETLRRKGGHPEEKYGILGRESLEEKGYRKEEKEWRDIRDSARKERIHFMCYCIRV